MSVFLEAALAYAAKGWPVFPCHPRSKIPATPHGFKDASTDVAMIRAWWELQPDCNVAIATGEASGVYVLDLDDKPGRSVDEALQSLGLAWPETPTVRTGGGGVQLFYAFPTGSDLSITGGKLGFGIDTRGNGGYVVAPPSIHPNGIPYKWMDCEDAELEPTPAVIIDKLRTQRTKAFLSSGDKLTGGRHHNLMTAAALARGIGFVPREIAAALREMVHRLDLRDGRVVTDKEVTDIANWTGDKEVGTLNFEAVVHGEQVARSLARGMGEAAAELVDDLNGTTHPGPFPKHLLTPGGTLGLIVDFINATAIKRQPILAMGAAVAAMGVIAGRRVQTDWKARTNFYCVGIGSSACGKDHARGVVVELLTRTALDRFLGGEDLASGPAVVTAVARSKAVLFQLDEMGMLLKTMGDASRNPALYAIQKVLMELYSSAKRAFRGKEYRDAKEFQVINQPHVCVYGTTVPKSFYESMNDESVSGGFLGRLLVFESEDEDPPKQRNRVIDDPPQHLLDAITAWDRTPPGAGNLAWENPRPFVVRKTPEAEEMFAKLEIDVRQRRKVAHEAVKAIWGRAEENADKLALLHACSLTHVDPVIGPSSAKWAIDLAMYLAAKMTHAAATYVSENAVEAATKRLTRIIAEAGERGLTKSEVIRKTQGFRKRDREEHLAGIIESGEVSLEVVPTATKQRCVYRLSRFSRESSKSSNNSLAAMGKEGAV